MAGHAPILTIGNAIVDIIARADDAFIEARGMNKSGMNLIESPEEAARLYDAIGPAVEVSGGSAANTAVGIVSCGGGAGFIGKVGDDSIGRIFTHDITAAGVEFTPAMHPEERTATSVVLVTPDAERTMNTHLGACRHLEAGDIDPERVAAAEWAYFEGYLFDTPAGRACFELVAGIAADAGTKLAFTLSDAWFVDRHHGALTELVAGRVDLLFGNEAEIGRMTGQEGDAMLDAASGLAAEVVVTKSERGSVILAGGERVAVPAMEGVTATDPTGAGDLYAAGYLHARQGGGDRREAAMNGTAAAAEVITHLGARPERPLVELMPYRGA